MLAGESVRFDVPTPNDWPRDGSCFNFRLSSEWPAASSGNWRLPDASTTYTSLQEIAWKH
jgi:hypothetical protein